MKTYLCWSLWQLYLLLFWPTRFKREVEDYHIKEREMGLKQRFFYLLKMLPWMAAFAVFANVASGRTCELLGIEYRWMASWVGVAVGVAFSVVVGVAVGVAFSVTFSVAVSVAVSVAFGVAFVTPRGVADMAVAAPDVALSVAVGVAFGVARAARRGVAIGVAVGVAVGVAFGVMLDVPDVAVAVPGAAVAVPGAAVAVPGVAVAMAFGVAFGVAFGMARSTAIGLAAGVAVGVAVGAVIGIAFGRATGVAAGVAAGVAFPLTLWSTYLRFATYPFDVALSVFTYFAGRRNPRALGRLWHWCPVAWNEVIWLPLPFVGKLLALLVRQDREEGFRQITFVAAERALQRRTARSALVEVAIEDLGVKSVTELAGATDKLRWTTDAPAELPAELTTALPRFDRAAQHAGQYLALQGPYRRAEVLDRALEEVAVLQRSLITARGSTAPRLLRAANEWVALLEAERTAFRTQVKAAREVPNPFIFGNPVKEQQANVFSGRQEIVRQLEESILAARQAPTLLLYGPRRMGKTSILNQLPRLLGPDFAPAMLDCQNPAATGSAATLLRLPLPNAERGPPAAPGERGAAPQGGVRARTLCSLR